MSITPATQTVKPGQQAAFVVAVENTSQEAQAQSMELMGLPDAWYSIEFDSRNRAFPGERRVANIVISVPENADGRTYEFTIAVLAGASESTAGASVEVPAAAPEPAFVEPQPEPEPEPEPEARDAEEVVEAPVVETPVVEAPVVEAPVAKPVYVAPMVSLELGVVIWRGQDQAPERKLLSIKNPGTEETDYVLEVQGLEPNWYTLLSQVRVGAGQELSTDFTIQPPEGARQQDYPFRIVVRVDGEPNLRSETSGWLSLPAAAAAAAPAQPVARAPAPVEPAPAAASPPVDRVPPPDVVLSPRTTFRFGPGEPVAQALVTVTNRGRVRERYQIVISGIPEDWYRLSDTDVRLDPGENTQISLRLSPVTGPGLPAGEYQFLVRALPDGMADHFGEALGVLSIIGMSKFDARLEPLQAEGTRKVFTVRVSNTGDMPLTMVLEPSDPENRCKFKVPAPRSLEPGQEGHFQLRVGARRNGIVGPRETFDFRVKVSTEEGEAQSERDVFDGRFVHRPKLPWRAVFLTGFFAGLVGVVFLLVWLASPTFESGANWVGCQLDAYYRFDSESPEIKKDECGGRPREDELEDWREQKQGSFLPAGSPSLQTTLNYPAGTKPAGVDPLKAWWG